MKTRAEIMEILKDRSNYGSSIISASIGNGGAGLNISSHDFSDELESMQFDGKVEPCIDIKECIYYYVQCDTVYQFSDKNNDFKIQIVI